MKNLLVAVMALILTTMSCTKSDDNLQSNDSEIQTRRRPSGGSINTGIPAVTGLSATATSSTSVYLTWNSVPNATSYRIYRDIYVPGIVTSTNYTDRSVHPGTTYTYSIAAVVNSTLGPKSSPVTVTTP